MIVFKVLQIALLVLIAMFSFAFAEGDSVFYSPDSDSYKTERLQMVRKQIESRGVTDEKVLEAMRTVPRHLFVPRSHIKLAYSDGPLPIGHDQTISQPYIVALMTELLELKGGERVLEIGTGSGYQTAVLAEIVDTVYSIEIICELTKSAQEILDKLGYSNALLRCADGYRGIPDAAPFDRVIVTAAPDHIPDPLIEQLSIGGRMVLPVGDFYQELVIVEKTKDGVIKKRSIPVRFVPMTGEAQDKK
jgi:protein-L-isoaspartate(D-aspartate) O-methyltransferase